MNIPVMTTSVPPNLYTFNPDDVMMYLAQNDWAGCWDYLVGLLSNLSSTDNAAFNLYLQQDLKDEAKKTYITQFGALISELILALLVDPSSKLSDKHFTALMCHHETLHTLLYLVGLEQTDPYVAAILNASKSLSELQQKKCLLLASLHGELDIVSLLKRMDSKYRIQAVTCWLSTMKISHQAVYDHKVKVMALRHDLEKTDKDYDLLTRALFAYFNCSYMDIPARHAVKDNVNKAVLKYIQASHKEFSDIRRSPRRDRGLVLDPAKPIVLVMLEIFSKGHAMNRSWGEWVNSLKSAFNVIILAHEGGVIKIDDLEHPNILTFANKNDLVKVCHDVAPDIIVYPSVGMDMSGLVASNMRLAPLQIMALGHPAPSMSEQIDFVYGQACLFTEQAFPRDIYIADDAPVRFIPYLSRDEVMAQPIYLRTAGDKGPLRVSIVGTNLKLSAPFITLLQEIKRESVHPIHFAFHLGSTGIDSLYLQKYLNTVLGDVTFHGYQTYRHYWDCLAQADIILNPFPFGHTNTIIDTLLLGKPCIGLIGTEPASRTETCILDIVGLTDQFVATDIADYKQKFVMLTQQIMNGHHDFYDRERVYDRLYGMKQTTDFGKNLEWIYQHQQDIKVSGHKMVRVFDPRLNHPTSQS